MFTQCPKCETVFRLSAETLRAADGQVRCGRCGEAFNALARLAEEPSAFIQGDTPQDMENRANIILEFPPAHDLTKDAPSRALDSDPGPGVEIAHLQVVEPGEHDRQSGDDSDSSPGTSLEFTLPPGELDRIFLLESRSRSLRRLALDADLPEPALHPESRHPESRHPEGDAALAQELEDKPAQSVEAPTNLLLMPLEKMHPVPQVAKSRPAAQAPGGRIVLDLPQEPREAVSAVFDKPVWPEVGLAPRRRIPFGAWLGAAIALGLLLIAQIVLGNRDWLASHIETGSRVRGLFSMVGVEIPASTVLSVYQLREWGVAGDPAAAGTLRVRASVLNTSAQLQPYPLLRVTLANRFGTRLGAREFEAAEYMGRPMARLLNPGERMDANIDILDPGKDAEGFEIDVCLRNAEKRLFCSGDTASSK